MKLFLGIYASCIGVYVLINGYLVIKKWRRRNDALSEAFEKETQDRNFK